MATYVLVHGIAHGAWCWDHVRADLTARGHAVLTMDLPLTSLADDAAAVARVLDEAREPVVLVGHSYGGAVISRAATDRDDVRHLVYVAAILLDGDDAFLARSAEYPATPLAERATYHEDGRVTVHPEAAVTCFYNTCDPAEARAAAARLRPSAVECLAIPTGGEPWRTVPSTYVLCEQDRAVHPDLQRWMSSRASRTVVLDVDHSPFYSARGPLLEILLRAAAGD